MKKQMNKAQEWWFNRSPLLKKQLTIKHFPETNYNYLSQKQIFKIYEQEQVLWNSKNRN
jgi:hypothetical protein